MNKKRGTWYISTTVLVMVIIFVCLSFGDTQEQTTWGIPIYKMEQSEKAFAQAMSNDYYNNTNEAEAVQSKAKQDLEYLLNNRIKGKAIVYSANDRYTYLALDTSDRFDFPNIKANHIDGVEKGDIVEFIANVNDIDFVYDYMIYVDVVEVYKK